MQTNSGDKIASIAGRALPSASIAGRNNHSTESFRAWHGYAHYGACRLSAQHGDAAQHQSTESHELPEASFWRSADTRHCRSAFVCLWRLCQVGICKSAGKRENGTRELEEPVSGPSRRPALEAPQPQTGGGSARERENVSRANVSGCLWIALDFVGSG